MKKQLIDISKLVHNEGQIPEVPANPRVIDETAFELLKSSVERSPEYLHVRPLLVYEQQGAFVVLCGNQRLEAAKALGLKEVPCKVIPKTTPRKLRAYIMKENIAFGSDDREGMREFTRDELKMFGKEFYLTDPVKIEEMIGEDERGEDVKINLPESMADVKYDLMSELQQALAEFEDVKVK